MLDMSISVDATKLIEATKSLVDLFKNKSWPAICRKSGYEITRSLIARTVKNPKPYPKDIRRYTALKDPDALLWFEETTFYKTHEHRAMMAFYHIQLRGRGGFLQVFPDWPKFGAGRPYPCSFLPAERFGITSAGGRQSLRDYYRYGNAGLAKQSWRWLNKRVDGKGGDNGRFAVSFAAFATVDGPAAGSMRIRNRLGYINDALPAGAVDDAINAATRSVLGQIERRLARRMSPWEAKAEVRALLSDLERRAA